MTSDAQQNRASSSAVTEHVPPPGSSVAYDYSFNVLETHLDVFGHMNNATYLQIFEEARWELITQRGFGLSHIMKVGQGPVILEVTVKFLKELRCRDRIRLQTWCSPYEGKTARLTQVMFNEKNEACCRADFVFGLFDLKARRLIAPTHEWLKAVGF